VFVPLNPHVIEMERLCDEVAELAAHISAATARWLRLLARLDEEAGWGDGYKTLPHWLSWRCGMSVGTARDHVRMARALRKRPLVAAAFERGELSYSKARALMRLDDDFDEELMLSYARYASASQIETIVRGCRRCVAVERDAERQFADRSFSWGYDEGGVVFKGRLPAEQGSLVVRALEAARDKLGPPPAEITEGAHWSDAEQTTSPGARRADTFIAVATTALADKASSADVYQIIVHVDADSLTATGFGDDAGCTLEDGAPLPAEVARRLACDASIVRVIEGWQAAFNWTQDEDDLAGAEEGPEDPRQGLRVPRLLPTPSHGRPPRRALGGRRRHRPRQPRPTLPLPPHADPQGALQGPPRTGRRLHVPESERDGRATSATTTEGRLHERHISECRAGHLPDL
jgi:hypothetical protein